MYKLEAILWHELAKYDLVCSTLGQNHQASPVQHCFPPV